MKEEKTDIKQRVKVLDIYLEEDKKGKWHISPEHYDYINNKQMIVVLEDTLRGYKNLVRKEG